MRVRVRVSVSVVVRKKIDSVEGGGDRGRGERKNKE